MWHALKLMHWPTASIILKTRKPPRGQCQRSEVLIDQTHQQHRQVALCLVHGNWAKVTIILRAVT